MPANGPQTGMAEYVVGDDGAPASRCALPFTAALARGAVAAPVADDLAPSAVAA